MTIANSFAAKLSVALVAIAMALTVAAPAQAQTAEELQAEIDALMATIESLQSQIGAGGSASASADAYAFTRSLTVGSQGADVTALQTYLIGAGFSIPAGATGYFGSQTQAAVAAWQSANGVMPAAGYFGPLSTAKYNALMADGGSDSDDDDDSSSDSGDLEGGEASLEDFQGQDGEDTDLEEGQENAPVAGFEFDVEDGDAEVDRVDVAFDADSTNTEDEPWETFEEVSIWVDGDEVASMAADDEDDWSEDDPYTGAHTLRFTGVDTIFREGDTAQIVVAVTVAGSVDGADSTETWEVFIPENGIRATDAEGIDQYIGEDSDTSNGSLTEQVSFDIDEEGGDDELQISNSSENPDASTLQVDADDKSDWMTIFAFDLDTDDSTNDIEVDKIPVTITPGGDAIGDIINDLQLSVDGETFDDWSYATGTSASTSTVVVLFDLDNALTIEAGEEVTAELQVEFKALAIEGSTIDAAMTDNNVDNIEAEGADDLTSASPDQLTGTADGKTHTLRTSGVTIELDSTSETLKANTDSTTTDDEGVFTIEFSVTAFENDLYIDTSAASSTATSGDTDGVYFQVLDANGDPVAAATNIDASLSSSADDDVQSGHYLVAEGETETFTLTVEIDPSTSGFHKVQLYSVNYDSDGGTTNDTWQRATPASDFETDALSI